MLVVSAPFPDRGAERRSGLVHCQCVESMLDSIRQVGVVKPELRSCVVDAQLLHPRDRGNAETAYSVEHPDCLDGDELAAVLFVFMNPGVLHLLELVSVGPRSVFPCGLVVEWDTGERVFVTLGIPVLHVLEDGEEELHTLSGQESEARDHAGNAPRGEGAAGEAENDELVAVDIIGANERVALTHNLAARQPQECA